MSKQGYDFETGRAGSFQNRPPTLSEVGWNLKEVMAARIAAAGRTIAKTATQPRTPRVQGGGESSPATVRLGIAGMEALTKPEIGTES